MTSSRENLKNENKMSILMNYDAVNISRTDITWGKLYMHISLWKLYFYLIALT